MHSTLNHSCSGLGCAKAGDAARPRPACRRHQWVCVVLCLARIVLTCVFGSIPHSPSRTGALSASLPLCLCLSPPFRERAPYPPGWSSALRYTAHLLASSDLLKSQQGSCGSGTGVGGAAWGGYARQLVQPFLDQVGPGAGIEEDAAILRDCVQVATAFVGGFKPAALQGNTRSGTMYP